MVKKEHVLEDQKLTVKKYFPQIDAKNINARSCTVSLKKKKTEEEETAAQHHVKPVKRPCTSVQVDDQIMQFISMNGVHFQELEGELDELYAEIEWSSGSNRVTIRKKADSRYIRRWVIRCKTVFAEFLNRFNKLSFSLEESIQNAISIALPRLVEIVSPEKALWKQTEEKPELMVVCLKEGTATVSQSIREFVEIITKENNCKTYTEETVRRKRVNHEVSCGVARFLKENLLKEINDIETRLKNDEVVIEVNVEKLAVSSISFRGTESGVDKCEVCISKLRRMVIGEGKSLSSPGLNELLFSETTQPYLKAIEIKNSVVIEMTRESRKDVKETSQTEVKCLRDELENDKKKKLPLVLDRGRFTTETRIVESTYDLCNFTTNKRLKVSWKYGNIADETVSSRENGNAKKKRFYIVIYFTYIF